MDETAMLMLMQKFRTAYGKADRDTLLAITSDDFEWHQHAAQSPEELPSGRILKGIDELLAELQWRAEHWRSVTYEQLEERAAGDVLVQTFVIQGEQDGRSFHAKAVDLYPVRDELIFRKDTYWKYLS